MACLVPRNTWYLIKQQFINQDFQQAHQCYLSLYKIEKLATKTKSELFPQYHSILANDLSCTQPNVFPRVLGGASTWMLVLKSESGLQ
jgi:hypothetical protein